MFVCFLIEILGVQGCTRLIILSVESDLSAQCEDSTVGSFLSFFIGRHESQIAAQPEEEVEVIPGNITPHHHP